jgi:hypothetical protein
MHRFPFHLFLCAALAPPALVGCGDSELQPLDGGTVHTRDDPAAGDDDDDDDTPGGGPYDDPDDDDDAGGDDDDTVTHLDDCPEDGVAITDFVTDDGDGEIHTLSWGPTWASATLVAPVAGRFAVYNADVYESGGAQTNESGYLRIRNEANPEGVPETPNCDQEHVVVDGDNDGPPPGPLVHMGTFSLVEGDNELVLHHYCPLFRAGRCGDLHIGDPAASSGCHGGGLNSLHFVGAGLCLVPR